MQYFLLGCPSDANFFLPLVFDSLLNFILVLCSFLNMKTDNNQRRKARRARVSHFPFYSMRLIPVESSEPQSRNLSIGASTQFMPGECDYSPFHFFLLVHLHYKLGVLLHTGHVVLPRLFDQAPVQGMFGVSRRISFLVPTGEI